MVAESTHTLTHTLMHRGHTHRDAHEYMHKHAYRSKKKRDFRADSERACELHLCW